MKTTSWTANISRSIKIPRRNDERVIVHFDYDCFYASVFENESPSLKSQPLGIKQKSILATCNYVARARGVKKLMLISDAQRICPDLVLMNGEDLTRFRDVSKRLWAFLRAHSWNHRVERLGLDEVFLDVTDVIAYNQEMVNPHALGNSFFHLDRSDPVKGFAFDGSRFAGCVQPQNQLSNAVVEVDVENPLCVRLMLASHLASYLRHKLDDDFGFTSSCGISTNKVLAKLAGTVNKPNNQTTLLPTDDDGGDAVATFMDAHSIRKVPGIGSRIAQSIEEYLLSQPSERRDRESTKVSVGEARMYPGMSADLLEQILDRPGAERGSGEKIWNLLHGVDPSEVKETSDVPTQISIEDTYMSRPLQTPADVVRELSALAASLIRRMRVDLTETDLTPMATTPTGMTTADPPTPHWLAYPKTLRLSTRTKPKATTHRGTNSNTAPSPSVPEAPNFNRSSRSTSLPSFVFQFASSSPSPHPPSEEIAARLVSESLLPLFRRLHPERHGGWNLALLNVCVTNMVVVANEASSSGAAPGRDIGRMFRTQENKLREWTAYDTSPVLPALASAGYADGNTAVVGEGVSECTYGVETTEGLVATEPMDKDVRYQPGTENAIVGHSSPPFGGDADDDDAGIWDEDEQLDSQCCEICGHMLPAFAMAAHHRFHAMDG
ncbi:hypothetical protein F4808DRAFT_49235 [Astrocystis sublimbata]|nr:hypothetical protein F4808DRAFT_49235 [Astrocystis sublimbata]